MSKPPYPILRIDLIDELDLIDDCHWAIWSVEVHLLDGTIIEGCSIQSDGFEMAFETLEDENGAPLDLSRYGAAP